MHSMLQGLRPFSSGYNYHDDFVSKVSSALVTFQHQTVQLLVIAVTLYQNQASALKVEILH